MGSSYQPDSLGTGQAHLETNVAPSEDDAGRAAGGGFSTLAAGGFSTLAVFFLGAGAGAEGAASKSKPPSGSASMMSIRGMLRRYPAKYLGCCGVGSVSKLNSMIFTSIKVHQMYYFCFAQTNSTPPRLHGVRF